MDNEDVIESIRTLVEWFRTGEAEGTDVIEEQLDDGTLVVVYRDGRICITPGVGLDDPSNHDDDEDDK